MGETEYELVHYCSQGPAVQSSGVHRPRLPHTYKNIPPSMVFTDYYFPCPGNSAICLCHSGSNASCN